MSVFEYIKANVSTNAKVVNFLLPNEEFLILRLHDDKYIKAGNLGTSNKGYIRLGFSLREDEINIYGICLEKNKVGLHHVGVYLLFVTDKNNNPLEHYYKVYRHDYCTDDLVNKVDAINYCKAIRDLYLVDSYKGCMSSQLKPYRKPKSKIIEKMLLSGVLTLPIKDSFYDITDNSSEVGMKRLSTDLALYIEGSKVPLFKKGEIVKDEGVLFARVLLKLDEYL